MPWTETCAMNERMCFVAAYLDGAESIIPSCIDWDSRRAFQAGGFLNQLR